MNNIQQITDHPLIDMDAASLRYYGPFRIDRLTFARSLLMACLALMFVCLSMTSSAHVSRADGRSGVEGGTHSK